MSECDNCPPIQGDEIYTESSVKGRLGPLASILEDQAINKEDGVVFHDCPDEETEDAKTDCCVVAEETCTRERKTSKKAPASVLPYSSAEDIECGDGAQIMLRKGKKLAQFKGSGFIQVIDGIARLSQSVKLKVQSMWHDLVIAPGSKRALVGDPKPFPYLLILDADGCPHAIKGFDDAPSQPIWNKVTRMWEIRKTSEVPISHKGKIPFPCKSDGVDEMTLIGFDPMSADEADPANVTRTPRGFGSEGLISIHKIEAPESPAAEGCGDCFGVLADALACDKETYVARVTPFPEDDQDYMVCWNKATGFTFTSKSESSGSDCAVDGNVCNGEC